MGMPPDRTYTVQQLAFAALVVLVFAFLTYTGKVSGDATIALVSGVTGAVLAAPLAAKGSQQEARAEGIKEGIEHQITTANHLETAHAEGVKEGLAHRPGADG